MNWLTVATALAPENILLLGIVALLLVEIVRAQAARRDHVVGRLRGGRRPWPRRGSMRRATRPSPSPASSRPIRQSSLAKVVVLALALPVLLLSRDDFEGDGSFHILLLSSLYGACLLLSSDSFLTLFLGLEMHVAAGLRAGADGVHARSGSLEAALKYLVLGGAATATFLMGVSLLYGGSGSLSLSVVRRRALHPRSDGHRGGGAGADRVLPQGRHRAVPCVGAGRLRGRQRAGHRLHGDDRQGGDPARRAADRRRRAADRDRRRPVRDPAAGIDRLGQPGGDAADTVSAG